MLPLIGCFESQGVAYALLLRAIKMEGDASHTLREVCAWGHFVQQFPATVSEPTHYKHAPPPTGEHVQIYSYILFIFLILSIYF